MKPFDLLDYKHNIYSQNGEDGIIEELFRRIGFKSNLCCEFGAWDGTHFSNTKNLIEKYGLTAFMIEGDNSKFLRLQKTYSNNSKVICINAFVDAGSNSLDKLLRQKGVDDNAINTMDLLSIDIDGLDYEIFEGLDIRPRVIVVEVNAGHDPEDQTRLPMEVSKNLVGQPLSLFSKTAKEKGYVLVCYNGNAFYLLKEVAEEFNIPVLSDVEAYENFLNHLSHQEKEWLTLVNTGHVVPFYKFNNHRLTPEYLKVKRPSVPFKERLKKDFKELEIHGYLQAMLNTNTLLKVFRLMATAKAMAETYDANRQICKYVHSTSRGHEAIQIATGFQLKHYDWFSPYYRDDSIMLSSGFTPYELMLQLLAKRDDPFSGGRSYYCHPSNKDGKRPGIIHQSSATGMQGIPTTGLAQGIQYLEKHNQSLLQKGENGELPVVICSFGDNSITEGEVSEAFQFAVLKQLPIVYLVQDNQWGISVSVDEARAMNAYEYAAGFKGLARMQCDGSDFTNSFQTMSDAVAYVRKERKPILVHATVPLLGHHTSGVRKEFYRSKEDLEKHSQNDPYPKLRSVLLSSGISEDQLKHIESEAAAEVAESFVKAQAAPDPDPASVADHVFAPTPVKEEKGNRSPKGGEKTIMVDAALHAVEEIMQDCPEAILYGQDVGRRLGGVFREAATLAEKFGDHRVFNTAIQEAYIVGSTIGLSALGMKPIVEVQFADYIYPGLNQLVTEISKSSYLTMGKFPIQMVLRVPIGAYGGGGPYHSGSVESTLLIIKGIKVVYPSNAADMKGLMKAAFHDPNPVVMLEHKGLYWSKVPGTEDAKTIEPAKDYILPLGKANIVLQANADKIKNGESLCIVTYGMGVYWAKAAAQQFPGQIEIIDLRTLYPLDEELIFESGKRHGRVMVLTEEQQNNSFSEALALRITNNCFHFLDARVEVMGALNLPAVPINLALEAAMLPTTEKVVERIEKLLRY